MSDDQSFYEIQLNTPHLVLAFLGAAVVGVTVFWLGVVIGRGQTEPPGGAEWQAAVALDDAEQVPPDFSASEPVSEPAASLPDDAAPAEVETPEETLTPPPDDAATSPSTPDFTPADPVEEQPAEVVAESSSGLPQHDPSLATGWIVQVRSTPEKPDADSLQSALVTAGFPAFVVSAEVSGVTWYRVRVGRYGSQGEAQVIEAELLGRSDVETTWVTGG